MQKHDKNLPHAFSICYTRGEKILQLYTETLAPTNSEGSQTIDPVLLKQDTGPKGQLRTDFVSRKKLLG